MSLPKNTETFLQWATDSISQEPKTSINYQVELEKIGLPETSIDARLIERFKNHLTLYQSGPEANIALLHERITSEQLSTVEQKIVALEKWITEQEATSNTQVASLWEQATEAVTNAVSEAAESAVDKVTWAATDAVTQKVDGVVKWFLSQLPFIWDSLAGNFSIGNWLKWIIASLFGAGSFFWGFFSFWKAEAGEREVTEIPVPPEVPAEEVKPVTSVVVPEVIKSEDPSELESPEENRKSREALKTAWYNILIQMSGLDYGENLWITRVYQQMHNKSINDLTVALAGEDPKSELNIDGSDDTFVRSAILGIVWPINKPVLESRLSVEGIKNILFDKSWEQTEIAKKYLGVEVIQKIQEKDFQYTSLDLDVLSILLSLSFKDLILSLGGKAFEEISSFWVGIKDIVFSQQTYTAISSIANINQMQESIYPESIALAFASKNILAGKDSLKLSIDQIREWEEEKIPEWGPNYKKLEEIIAFKDSVLKNIPETYSFGLAGFDENFKDTVNYWKILSLYVLLEGKDPTNLDSFWKVILYSWILRTLTGESQSGYLVKMAESLVENNDTSTEDEKVLTAVLYRISDAERNSMIGRVNRIKWAVDTTIETQLNEHIKDPFALKMAIWAVEIWGIALLLKFLLRMPVLRAVLVATSGVVAMSIFFGLKEGIYRKLDSDIAWYYEDYIDALIEATWNFESREKLEASINRWDTSMANVAEVIDSVFKNLDIEKILKSNTSS